MTGEETPPGAASPPTAGGGNSHRLPNRQRAAWTSPQTTHRWCKPAGRVKQKGRASPKAESRERRVGSAGAMGCCFSMTGIF